MTDRERIEKTYRKIQTKYPQITNKDEVDTLAIKLDKRNTLLIGLGCFVGAIVCSIISFVLAGNETYEMTRYIFLVMTGSGLFECFRTLGKYSKIEQRYRPVLKVKYEGELTKDRILKDGRKLLKKTGNIFNIVKLPLYDKEEKTEIGMDNDTYHDYYLYFKRGEYESKITYQVKRSQYMDAVIGAEYFVVFTPTNEIATIYQATNWSVTNELAAYIIEKQSNFYNMAIPDSDIKVEQSDATNCQTDTIKNNIALEKTKKLLPILSIVLIVLSYFFPVIIGFPMGIVAFVLSVIGLIKQKNKLSISAIVINLVLLVLLVILAIVMIS